jgi:hypothetical protein
MTTIGIKLAQSTIRIQSSHAIDTQSRKPVRSAESFLERKNRETNLSISFGVGDYFSSILAMSITLRSRTSGESQIER